MADRSDRLHVARASDVDGPSPFEQDRDRILHSPVFRRLTQITQVMAPNEQNLFQNRHSHSLEVARIGRALALSLLRTPDGKRAADEAGGLDPAVVESAALAHDLGHPPFGHDAEDELDHLLTEAGVADGFEANAQSFRVVCKLAESGANGAGLNLTRATLAAILKYPWERHESSANPTKWGAYESESAEMAWARAMLPPGSQEPTLEAALMDWADLIAYAVRDCEDFICAGLIPIERLSSDGEERERFLDLVRERRRIPAAERDSLADTFERVLNACPIPRHCPSTRAGRAALRCFTNHQINAAISAAALVDRDGGSHLEIRPETTATILLFEGLTWHYVIDSGLLQAQRNEQRRNIRVLFQRLADVAIARAEHDVLSPLVQKQLRATNSDAERLRIVADVIASMTEDVAIAWCQRER